MRIGTQAHVVHVEGRPLGGPARAASPPAHEASLLLSLCCTVITALWGRALQADMYPN